MIEAKSLRIGNCYSNGQGIYTLSTSDFMDFLNEAQVHDGKVANIDPIPLTPENILNSGLEKHDPDSIYKCVSYTIWNDISCFRIMEHLVFDKYNYTIPCYPTTRVYHLHQLQNLFWILTGEELTVNL